MFGLDMSIWNRVEYPERKHIYKNVCNTAATTVVVGICSLIVTMTASKIVQVFVF